MADKREIRYIGASVDDFVRVSSEQVKSGKYFDGTTIPEEVRRGLDSFVKALESPSLTRRHYVFVYSTHIFVNIEHDVLSKKP
jgi:hypothetical protein